MKEIPVKYKGKKVNCAFMADMIVEDTVILELKSIDKIMPIHNAQIITYLKISGKKIGLLINFNVNLLKNGIRSIVI